MNNRIQKITEHLLNTRTTSEKSFIQEIEKNNELFHMRHQNDFKQVVDDKLRHWQNISRTEQRPAVVTVTASAKSTQPSENSSKQEESSFENDQKKPLTNDQVGI